MLSSDGCCLVSVIVFWQLLLLKNFNLCYNFQTRSDRAFMLHMCIPYDKAFHMVP